jgi:hypothetical protein
VILTFPYHDPSGTYNEVFRRQLPALQDAFSTLCISATALTAEQNGTFVDQLEQAGCLVTRHEPGSALGEHFCEALRLAVRASRADSGVYFGFIDRILYAFESEWKSPFLADLEACQELPLVTFERTHYAWSTHPDNYREVEQMVSRLGVWLLGTNVEFGLCGLALQTQTAATLLAHSTSPSMEILGEWMLLAAKHGIPIAAKQVDWVLWEDPYWEGVPHGQLKAEREQSAEETIRRIRMNVPFMLLLTEERFRGITLEVKRL